MARTLPVSPARLRCLLGLAAPRPPRYRAHVGLHRIVARTADDAVAWRVDVDESWFDPQPAIAVPGGLVFTTASGHVVVLGYDASTP
jgi:hypothetical protein